MKKLTLIVVILVFCMGIGIILTAQGDAGGGGAAGGESKEKISDDFGKVEDESNKTDKGTQEESLYRISIENFERAGEWNASIPIQYGLVNIKEIAGAPLELAKKKPEKVKIPPKYGKAGNKKGEAYFETEIDEHKQVLGIKVAFMQRAYSWVQIAPPFPIKLEGMVKGFELWVAGRNKRHTLYIVVQDFYNKDRVLEVGPLNFIGWKKMVVQIPYTVAQEDFRFSTSRGLVFKGFLIKFHPEETVGRYYVYFDNLSAELSRFLEENRDADDLLDTW